MKFEDAAKDLINDYATNGKKSLDEVRRRIDKHLKPFFEGWKLSAITTTDVREYIAKRQGALIVTGRDENRKERNVSNGEINRELTALKRIFSLAFQAGKILHKPYIPLLRENNTRTGFFELEQFRSVRAHLPEPIRPVVTFAYITRWRITGEVLPLQWRHVNFKSGEIRLDAGTTKNGGEGVRVPGRGGNSVGSLQLDRRSGHRTSFREFSLAGEDDTEVLRRWPSPEWICPRLLASS